MKNKYSSMEKILSYARRNETETNPCWVWHGGKGGGGYGFISTGTGTARLVHREVYEFVHGPTDLSVLHLCDNTLCVNPFHLVAGNQSLNMKHMYGRRRRVTKRMLRMRTSIVRKASKISDEIPRPLNQERTPPI